MTQSKNKVKTVCQNIGQHYLWFTDNKSNLLGPLDDFAVDLEQVGPLKSLVAEVLVVEVAVVHDGGVQSLCVLLDDLMVEV